MRTYDSAARQVPIDVLKQEIYNYWNNSHADVTLPHSSSEPMSPLNRYWIAVVWSCIVSAFTASVLWATDQQAYQVYVDATRQIHVKYPAQWHVRTEDTKDAHMVFISREEIRKPMDRYTVGLAIYQLHHMAGRINLDFANPDQAAATWIDAILQGTPGKSEVLQTKQIMVGGKPGYYADLFLHPTGGYPLRMLLVTIFYPDTFSYTLFESPADEYDDVKTVFQAIMDDAKFRF